jgi:hypothetical protein
VNRPSTAWVVVVALAASSSSAAAPPAAPRSAAASSGPSSSSSSSAAARLAAAVEDYRALRLEKVIDAVEDLLFDGALDDVTRARALYLLGLAYAQQGDSATARERLIAACALDPAVTLDVPLPRKVRSLVDGARQAAAARGGGTTDGASPPPTPGAPTGAAAGRPSSSSTPSSSTSPDSAGPWPWVVAATGGAVALAGGGVAAWGWSLATQGDGPRTTQRDAVALADAANQAFVVAAAAAAVGVVAAGSGVVWAVSDP